MGGFLFVFCFVFSFHGTMDLWNMNQNVLYVGISSVPELDDKIWEF